jgi:AcrR family transcriptional regulator
MARLAAGRTTQLSADEIAAELLRLFDESGGEPSIRALATSLGVSPRAIYHYYETREQLVGAAMDLVWEEAIADIVEQIADPLTDLGDPLDFFVIAGVATRRAFRRHRRLAMNLGMPSGASERLSGGLAIIGSGLEQLGLTGERAGLAMYTYTTYVLGSIMLDASRWSIERAKGEPASAHTEAEARALVPDDAPAVSDATFMAIDHVIAGGVRDPEVTEAMFAAGLRTLLRGFVDQPD